MGRRLQYRIQKEDLLSPVGQILKTRLGLTRHQIRSAKFRPDGILADGERVRVNALLREGTVLEVLLEQEPLSGPHLEPAEADLNVLYEDEDLLAVDKPAGMAVHPAHGHFQDTLSNYVLGYYRKCGISAGIRPIGRLDKDTSGVMLFAKSQAAAAWLWKRGRVKKEYWAVALGTLGKKQGYIEAPIGKKAGALNEMEVCPEGRFARTNYRVLEETGAWSLVSLTPETGRTHQIRLHLASIGHPLAGDPIYGKYGKDERCGTDRPEEAGARERAEHPIGRAALHCRRVVLQKPFSEEWLSLTADLPEDMLFYLCGQ